MFKKQLFIFFFTLLQVGVFAQNVSISNIVRTGRFQSCNNANPTIVASLLNSTGSTVQNGNLVVLDPCGFTTLQVTMSNLQWNQSPGANWFHGVFFPVNSGVTISGVVMPNGWAPFPSCTGAPCSAGETGGQGFYYDGTGSNSCCSGAFAYDGIPHNNFGDSSLGCGSNFTVKFNMTFCNSQIETNTLTFTLFGKADGNTGCWSTPDQLNNSVKFSLNTVASALPIFSPMPSSPQVITQCTNGNQMNYIAELVAGCGNGSDVTWWDAPIGGNMLGTGSPFLYDPPGNTCPAGQIVYAQCCPQGTECDARQPVVIGHCLPPTGEPIFATIPPQCPGMPNPLPAVSVNGATGTWSPAFDPFNTTTYTFTPDDDQCVTEEGQLTVEILPQIDLTFAPMASICQGETPPNLPQPNEPGVTGTWTPAVIDTTTPGTFQFTFSPDDACSADAVIEVTIEEKLIPQFALQNQYCQNETPADLPTDSDNGYPGTWSPAVIDTSTPGISTYTFTPSGTNCFETFEIQIEVVEEVIPTFNAMAPLCQNTVAPALPQPNENGVTGTWVPAVIDTSTPGTFEYTFTANAQCTEPVVFEVEILPEIIPDFILANHFCQFEDAVALPTTSDNGFEGTWSPATIDTSVPGIFTYTFTPSITSCSEPFVLQVEVVEQIIPTFNPMAELCQNTVAPALPQPNEIGVTGTWAPATIDTSTPGTFEFTFLADVECTEPVTFQVTVLEELIPNFVLNNVYCQFETPQNLALLSDNGIPGTWSPTAIDTNTPGTTTYTFTPDTDDCSVEFSFNVTVNPQPVLNTVPTQTLCDQDFDGVYEIDLSAFNPSLGGGVGTNYTYYASQADYNNNAPIPAGQLNNYQLTNLPATIYVTGTSGAGCRSEAVTILIQEGDEVIHNAGPFGPIKYCPESTVDLTALQTNISTAAGVQFSYFNTLNNAQIDAGAIANTTSFIPSNGQTSVFVRLDANGKCSAIVELLLEKLPTPDLMVDQLAQICEGDAIDVTATSDLNNVTFEWTLANGSVVYGATQSLTDAGVYSVTAYSIDGCRSVTRSVTVSYPSQPTIVSLDLTGNSITVGAVNNGEGPMEYSLDGVFWQNTNVFHNLIPGQAYTVWVRSAGCMIAKYDVVLLSLPNFFSPNGDGKNDTWAIRGIETSPNATIKIFDRYGKMMVDTKFEGGFEWNGKYMGRTVAADDYWYIIHIPSDGITTEKRFVGHVTVRNK